MTRAAFPCRNHCGRLMDRHYFVNPLWTFLTTFYGANDYATQGTDADAVVNSEDKIKLNTLRMEKQRAVLKMKKKSKAKVIHIIKSRSRITRFRCRSRKENQQTTDRCSFHVVPKNRECKQRDTVIQPKGQTCSVSNMWSASLASSLDGNHRQVLLSYRCKCTI